MTLSKLDIENIEKLINIEELILNVYNELINLEINDRKMEIYGKYDYLKSLYSIESNSFKEFDDIDKYQMIIEYIDNNYDKKNPIILQRIINQLNDIFLNYKHHLLYNQKNISADAIVERGNVITSQINQFITDDINSIFRLYLINNIKNTNNSEIKNSMIQYKYLNIFSNINNNNEIFNVNSDNNQVYLSYKALFQVLHNKRNIPEFVLNQILFERINTILNSLINELLDTPDNNLFDSSQLAQAFIISFYIQSCLNFVNDESILIFKDDINKNASNSISKEILLNCVDNVINEDENKPKIYSISFYEKK